MPPLSTQRQQQTFPTAMIGSAERTPMTRAPIRTGWNLIVVVLTTEVCDQLFALQVPERVLQLHELNEQVVLRVQPRGVNGRFEIKRQPFLDAAHAGALGEIQEQGDVEHDRRGKDAVAAQEVDLELHRIAQPS